MYLEGSTQFVKGDLKMSGYLKCVKWKCGVCQENVSWVSGRHHDCLSKV